MAWPGLADQGDVITESATSLPSEWSTAVIRDHDVATPALLGHKEPAKGTQSPLVIVIVIVIRFIV